MVVGSAASSEQNPARFPDMNTLPARTSCARFVRFPARARSLLTRRSDVGASRLAGLGRLV
jgi:hypothetical protein